MTTETIVKNSPTQQPVIYWSKSRKGFYNSSINSTIPPDAVEITSAYWQELLSGQSAGKLIQPDSTGYPVLVDPPGPTKDQTITIISGAIQSALDAGAQKWGYDSIVAGASYAASTNAQFAADAAALIGWRDSVWAWANPKFATVTPGEDPAVFMADMPAQPAQPSVTK